MTSRKNLALTLSLGLTACHTALPLAEPVALPATGPTTVMLDGTPLHTNVKRLGINLSGQTFYDSGQMLRNLTFRNPGFEGETWQSILHCKSVSATMCTDANQYAVWPAGFLKGARLEVLSGAARGASTTVDDQGAASGGHGVTLVFKPLAHPLSAGDFVLVRMDKPGDAQAGWWTDLKGGASLGTESNDLSPHTPGRQALRIEAGQHGQSAKISSFFDSYEGRSFVQLHGRYTLTFRAKGVSPGAAVDVALERLDTTHGGHTFFTKHVALTQQWQDFRFDLEANDVPRAVGTIGLGFYFAEASALLDDVAFESAGAPSNPTVFRDEVLATLRDLRPGVLRYMDNGTDFGSSLDNMLAPPFARRRSGSSTQETRREDVPLGLHEFLTLCAAIGAEPWYAMPAGTSPAEAANLTEYLAGPATSPYGQRRAVLGHAAPWTESFATIHLELGNEQWNDRSFAGSAINDPTAYAQRASDVYAAIRRAPAYRPVAFDLILGSWATVPWWTQQELASSSAHDSVAVAPYLFNDFNDAASSEAIFGPMLAEPEAIDSRATGYMAQQAQAARKSPRPARLAVYETNLGVLSGSVTQAALDATVPSAGAGLAVADHMLLMLRDLGITTQCLFALPEYVNYFNATNGPKLKVPLWGAVVDMGGPTNLRRPTFLFEQLANRAILPTMLSSRITGADPTWDQPESRNGKIKLSQAHLLQSFAFADGKRRSLILLNLSRDHALPVRFDGAAKPTGLVNASVVAAPNIPANNESDGRVAIKPIRIDVAESYSLPPYSMTVLKWTVR